MNFTPRCEGCIPDPVILPKLNADRDQLIRFIGRVFRHAEGRVSLRAFTNRDQTPVFLEDAELSDQSLVERARAIATKAANDERGVVFSPPIATFNGARDPERGYLKADQKNLKQGLTLSVELDKNPNASRRKLEAGRIGQDPVAVKLILALVSPAPGRDHQRRWAEKRGPELPKIRKNPP